MVRVNLINPKKLSDQHLIAEYSEILILAEYIREYPKLEDIPEQYCLGKGHMKFFKDKLTYLKKRHKKLKSEMKKRKFKANKTIKTLKGKDWKPKKKDIMLIKKRIISKLRLKPGYYRYYGKYKTADFFIRLLK